jgi:hypothetical protein
MICVVVFTLVSACLGLVKLILDVIEKCNKDCVQRLFSITLLFICLGLSIYSITLLFLCSSSSLFLCVQRLWKPVAYVRYYSMFRCLDVFKKNWFWHIWTCSSKSDYESWIDSTLKLKFEIFASKNNIRYSWTYPIINHVTFYSFLSRIYLTKSFRSN